MLGAELGRFVGASVVGHGTGAKVGSMDAVMDGTLLGENENLDVGLLEGAFVGTFEGLNVGVPVVVLPDTAGGRVGPSVGETVGRCSRGASVICSIGIFELASDGNKDGVSVVDGPGDGSTDG